MPTIPNYAPALPLEDGDSLPIWQNNAQKAASLEQVSQYVSLQMNSLFNTFLQNDQISLRRSGGAENGTIDDTAALAAATADVGALGWKWPMLVTGTALVTSWNNPYGAKTSGPGNIVKQITGGVQQLNSYADQTGSHVIGKEYLFRVFQRASLGQSGPSGKIGCFLYGDSTVAGGYMSMPTADLLKKLFSQRGIGNIAITNRGVAGTQVSNLNALADLSSTTDLLIIKYGINDGTNPENSRLATFQSTFDAKLSAIRSAANGAVGNLAIVLVGPNATGDTPNGRDERWYEQLRGIYVALARKYQCCYIDTYAAFRDPRGGAGLWLTDDYGDGRGIHPRDSLGFQIWGLVVDTIISHDEAIWIGSTGFQNLSANIYAPSASATPSQFGLGIIHGRATVGNGWPREGFFVHQMNPDGGALQILYPFSANDTRILVRTANVNAGTWNRWSSAPENLILSNGWSSYGGTFATPSAFVDVSGVVHLRGVIAGGTTTAGTKIAAMPPGMTPAADCIVPCSSSSGIVSIKIQVNGDVILQTAGDASFTSLEGASFLAI